MKSKKPDSGPQDKKELKNILSKILMRAYGNNVDIEGGYKIKNSDNKEYYWGVEIYKVKI